jgi:hypothetical protein
VAVLLLFGYVLTHRYPAPAVPDGPAPTVPEVLRPPFGNELPRMTGGLGAGPAGLRALVGGTSPAVLDLHTGELDRLRNLPLAAGEQAALRPVRGGMVADLTAFNGVSSRTVLLRPGQRPVPLGVDVRVTPLRTGGLLVTSYAPGRTVATVRDAAGVRQAGWSLPGLVVTAKDTEAGLLAGQFATPGSSGADMVLLDPRSGAVRRRIAPERTAVAVGDTAVAHLPAGCGLDCPLTVTDVASGRSRDYPTPDQGPPAAGRFSPDGRRLALAVPGQYFSGRRLVRPGFVAVLDLATGAVVRTPGVETQAGRTADVDWSPDGRLLLLAVWSADRAEVGLWSPDRPAAPVVRLATQPPGDYRSGSVTVLP